MISKKTIAELYHENTSYYTKIYNLLFRLDSLLFPFLILGTFLGNDLVQFYSNLLLIILGILLFLLFSLDSYFRIKKGKKREKIKK